MPGQPKSDDFNIFISRKKEGIILLPHSLSNSCRVYYGKHVSSIYLHIFISCYLNVNSQRNSQMTRSINSQAKLKNFTIYFWINIQCGNWNSNIFRTGSFHLCGSCHELYSIILSPGCLPHAALARTHTDTHTHPLELRSVYG